MPRTALRTDFSHSLTINIPNRAHLNHGENISHLGLGRGVIRIGGPRAPRDSMEEPPEGPKSSVLGRTLHPKPYVIETSLAGHPFFWMKLVALNSWCNIVRQEHQIIWQWQLPDKPETSLLLFCSCCSGSSSCRCRAAAAAAAGAAGVADNPAATAAAAAAATAAGILSLPLVVACSLREQCGNRRRQHRHRHQH